MKKLYQTPRMLVNNLSMQETLLSASPVNSVNGNADLKYEGSSSGYEGPVRSRESAWSDGDSEW